MLTVKAFYGIMDVDIVLEEEEGDVSVAVGEILNDEDESVVAFAVDEATTPTASTSSEFYEVVSEAESDRY